MTDTCSKAVDHYNMCVGGIITDAKLLNDLFVELEEMIANDEVWKHLLKHVHATKKDEVDKVLKAFDLFPNTGKLWIIRRFIPDIWR